MTSAHPRAVLVWSAAALVCVMASTNPLYRLLILLVVANVVVASRRREARIGPFIRLVGMGAVFMLCVQLLLNHSGTHVIARLPQWLPAVGGPVTSESLVYGLTTTLGLIGALLCVAPLTLALDEDALVDAMPHQLQRTAAAVGSAITLIPRVVRTTTSVRDSQRLRGYVDRRTRVREILVPVVLTSVEDSLQIAEAMEARGFGAGRRTAWQSLPLRRGDVVTIVASVLAVFGVAWLRSASWLTDWYPFPSLSVPSVSLAVVPVALLLVVGAKAWQPR